jgi:hypothetical protein
MRGYDDWRTAGPPEPTWEGEVLWACNAPRSFTRTNALGVEEDVDDMCPFEGIAHAVVWGSEMTVTCPQCDTGVTRPDPALDAKASYDEDRAEERRMEARYGRDD